MLRGKVYMGFEWIWWISNDWNHWEKEWKI